VAGCCECGDEPSGSCATELVTYMHKNDKEIKLSGMITLLATAKCKTSLDKNDIVTGNTV
jgi:hypothetical protein